MENAISGLNFSTGLNFSVGSYNLNKANARVNYNTQVYDDIPDYNSDIELKEETIQPASEEEKSSVDWAKAVDKGNQKAFIKSIVGMFSDAKSLKIHNLGDGWSAGVEGLSTFIVAMAAGEKWDEAFSSGMLTFTKQWTKKLATKSLTDKAVQFFASQAKLGPLKIPGAASKGAVESLDDLVKVDVFKIDTINIVGSTVANFGVVGGINIAWNLAWDFLEDGSIDKPGTAIYKGAVMTVFSIAGKFIAASFGGNKLIESAFTVAGAWIAEFTVNFYKTEEGRGCAGVAILVGGAVGCALALALLSNPVGWAVGLCIIAGAIIAGFIAWVVDVTVGWDVICDWAVTHAENIWAGIKTGAVAAIDFVCDAGEWIADKAIASLKATKEAASVAYEWVEEKFDAAVEKVENFVSDAGEAVANYVEDAYDGVKDLAVGAWDLITSW